VRIGRKRGRNGRTRTETNQVSIEHMIQGPCSCLPMIDEEAIELIREAVRDVQNGSLDEKAFFYVIVGIVLPMTISQEYLDWAKKVTKRLA
jgi:hypothetical protein